jgi:hypothetical protein
MAPPPAHISPDRWLHQPFAADTAIRGGIVRRQVRDVERIVGRARFEAEVRHRGYRAVENAGHYVIFCNRAAVRVIG